jgi:hypothetical protein
MVTWTDLPSLAPGASRTVTVDARLADVDQSSYVNTAQIADDGASLYSTPTDPVTDRDSTPGQVLGEDDEGLADVPLAAVRADNAAPERGGLAFTGTSTFKGPLDGFAVEGQVHPGELDREGAPAFAFRFRDFRVRGPLVKYRSPSCQTHADTCRMRAAIGVGRGQEVTSQRSLRSGLQEALRAGPGQRWTSVAVEVSRLGGLALRHARTSGRRSARPFGHTVISATLVRACRQTPRRDTSDQRRSPTGRCLMPPMKFDRNRSGAPSGSSAGTRVASSSNSTRISMRARLAPRQKCGPPPPKAT